jgi:phospholipid transport system substrate-binding protein
MERSYMMLRKQEKKRSGLGVWCWVLTGMLTASVSAEASESPMTTIRTTVERSMAVLKDPIYQGEENFQKRIKKLEEIVLPQLDSLEFGRRCLGTHWQKLSDAQRHEFIELFKELIEKTYGGMLDRYPEGVHFSYEAERIDGSFAEVDTQVAHPSQGKRFSVVYRLNLKDGKWLIYDVVAENVSMVRNYRNQFSRIIDKSSFEELAQALRRKIQQLETAPTS